VLQVDLLPRAIFHSGEITSVPDESLLRTPSVTDSTGGAISEVQARERGRMVKTADQAAQLAYENGLPVSPSIAESLKDKQAQRSATTNFGKFTPAIERWETLTGRKAPQPTQPTGRNGAHRLSPEFTEWMMGLPEGWVTSVGLSRVAELKLCGNGVVPQQAKLALDNMVSDIIKEIKNG